MLPFEIKFVKNLVNFCVLLFINYALIIINIKKKARLNELEPDVGDEIDTPDVVLTVQISQALNNRQSKLAWSEDFLVLGIIIIIIIFWSSFYVNIYVNFIFINIGQNYLTDLKDKISCVKSEIKVGEFSQDPDQVKQAPRLGV